MAADYTTLHKRISKQDLGIEIPENDAVVAVDSTGIKVTNRGDWMREKHGKQRRGWLKVHVAVDVESKRLLSMEVTEEDTSDSEVLRPLLKDVNIEEGLMDGAYDTNDAFEFMKSKGVDCPGIKIRENAIVGKDVSARSTAVLEFKKMGYKGWKQMHQYGRRWAVEGFFSSIKRIFGETVRASSPEGMVAEIKRAFMRIPINLPGFNHSNVYILLILLYTMDSFTTWMLKGLHAKQEKSRLSEISNKIDFKTQYPAACCGWDKEHVTPT